MDYIIREIKEEEYPLLEDFLYEAIFVPEGVEAPPRSILEIPELQVSISNFGKQKHDRALVVEINHKIAGMNRLPFQFKKQTMLLRCIKKWDLKFFMKREKSISWLSVCNNKSQFIELTNF